MTEQTAQRPSPEGSVLVHELNHRVNNEVAAAIGVAFLAATRSGNDKLSAMDRRAGFDARDDAHCSSNINVSSESVGQRKAAKILARTRIFSSAAQLFLGYGIAGVSVEAIAKGAATAKRTLYSHFVSKDELVAEYLRESAKRLDVCWAEIGPLGSASALVQLGTWLAEMADGLVSGWACRLADATAQWKERQPRLRAAGARLGRARAPDREDSCDSVPARGNRRSPPPASAAGGRHTRWTSGK
jgi:AcrR family transcriptional regulator